MLYIGLTENHRESAQIFADVVGAQVISQFNGSKLGTDDVVPYATGQYFKCILIIVNTSLDKNVSSQCQCLLPSLFTCLGSYF